jgi:uncharacterized protein (DUF2267 family)
MNVESLLERLRARLGSPSASDAGAVLVSVLAALSPLVPWPSLNRLGRELPAEWMSALRSERFADDGGRRLFEARLRAVAVKDEDAAAVLRELSSHLDVRARHALLVALPDDLRAVLAA